MKGMRTTGCCMYSPRVYRIKHCGLLYQSFFRVVYFRLPALLKECLCRFCPKLWGRGEGVGLKFYKSSIIEAEQVVKGAILYANTIPGFLMEMKHSCAGLPFYELQKVYHSTTSTRGSLINNRSIDDK